jgi:D-alanyl-D-alanine carboxypeptidase
VEGKRVGALAIAVMAALMAPGAAVGHGRVDAGAVRRGLQGLIRAKGGPIGAIATLYRDRHLTAVSAGRANINHRAAPRASDHMRIASVSKAFNATVALRLVQRGVIRLDDTIGRRLPTLPAAWQAVTMRQLLDDTSGLPEYTKSDGFVEQLKTDPQGFVSPTTVIGWVASQGLIFPPGSRWEYSNTDNIVLGLITEAVTGKPYATLLRQIVFGRAKLRQTTLPSTVALPTPFIHGYALGTNGTLTDVSTSISPSGAWASGGIVSTPAELNEFMRDYLGARFFGRNLQRAQMHFVAGSSSPAGPGVNSAGRGIFRYRTRCGTVYGHTGGFPGYTQFAAATRDGRRAVTMSFNFPEPTGAMLARLRSVETTAVCALLRRRR